jgi:multiple sugar transport system permease protein
MILKRQRSRGGIGYTRRVATDLNRNKFYYGMLAPLVVIMAVLYLYPALSSTYLAFTEYDYMMSAAPEWTGLENFRTFFESPEGRRVLWNTLVFTVATVSIETVLGFLLALAFNREFFGKGIARALTLVPMMLAPVVVGYEWRWLYNDRYGLINYLLLKLHVIDVPVSWITSEKFAMVSLVVADVWYATPFIAIILMGGLQSLPQDPYEAAVIDGATAWQRVWYVTIPLLRPVLLAAVLIRTMDAFQTFDLIFIITYGGPGNLTEVMNTFTYKTAFMNFDLGYASTVATIALAIMVLLSLFLARVLRRSG